MHYYAASGKFKPKSVVIDGHTFPSKLEAKRYSQLKLMQAGNKISHLKPHPKLALMINGTSCGEYEADTGYIEGGRIVIEEVKGPVIKDGFFRLWRILQALYPQYTFRLMIWRRNAFVEHGAKRERIHQKGISSD